MKRKLLFSVVCAIALLLIFSVNVLAAPITYSDVSSGFWGYNDIQWVSEKGLMGSTGGTAFSPNIPASRAMLVTVLWRMEGAPASSGNIPFTDLKADWYKEAVRWGYANGIVNGTSATTFSPDSNITREQLVTLLCRYASFHGLNVSATSLSTQYPDHYLVSSWAKSGFAWATKNGIINGVPLENKLYLNPQGNATRTEMAAMLHRFDNNCINGCAHIFTKTVTVPTCIKGGHSVYRCSECGYTYTTDYTTATGVHVYNETVTEPTCAKQGYTTFSCKACTKTYKDNYVSATGLHDYRVAVTAPTCGDEGYTTYSCKNCTYSYKGNFVEATDDHDYTVVVTEPTCTEDGYTTHSCKNCSHSYTDNYILAEGYHDFTEVVTEATCTQDGYTTYTCTNCSYSYKGNYVIGDHDDEYGKCNQCGKITNGYLYLGYWLIDNGSYSSSTNSYVYIVPVSDNVDFMISVDMDTAVITSTTFLDINGTSSVYDDVGCMIDLSDYGYFYTTEDYGIPATASGYLSPSTLTEYTVLTPSSYTGPSSIKYDYYDLVNSGVHANLATLDVFLSVYVDMTMADLGFLRY